MEMDEMADQYFTHEGRLASFKAAQPVARRPSNAKGKAPKAIAWPHKQLDPAQFASAGLYFEPTPEAPDNTVCFLCVKAVAGWEDDDNPLEEHLRLSPHCGWAIIAAIDAGLGDYALDDPSSAEMAEARKATFGRRWPHDGKRGWKCKTKQLVEAGWKYTPTSESNDMATCTYCSLALDGWEPKDNPWDEHYKRSPGCHFFSLMEQYKKEPGKKKGKGKGARASQASRLSVQSAATTAASDATSMLEHPADHEDSVMTTTSVMTQGGTKRTRAKKGTTTTAKGKKTRAKKEEAVEVLEDAPEVEEPAPLPPPKPTRGRKRASDTLEDSVLSTTEGPATKKRATRNKKADAADASVIDQDQDQEMHDVDPAPKPKAKGKKGRSTNSRNTRKTSAASTVSATSVDENAAHLMDDEELDRQLQADLDRPLSDEENIAADSDSDRKAPAKQKGKKVAAKKVSVTNVVEASDDHAMFDPEPPQIDEAQVDADLKALETEMELEEAETLPVPKKGRKAGVRKTSKQTTKKAKEQKAKEPEPEPEPEQEPNVEVTPVDEDELAEGHEASIVSNATVVRTSLSSNAAPKKRGRPSKKAAAVPQVPTTSTEPSDPEPDELAQEARNEVLPQTNHVDFAQSSKKLSAVEQESVSQVSSAASSEADKPLPPPPAEAEELNAPATPKVPVISPAPAAKQATISPSPSPQPSDAENEPPSSKPSNTDKSSRVALAPVAATPVRTSPSKRNILAGLQSTAPWNAVDVEALFEELDNENNLRSAKFLKGDADITSPEKRMTVEEWIHHNAEEAQQKLRVECEAMVTAFEKEGTKAMQTLEGLVVD
ncbi:hypothetical protein GGR52DRAFT_562766 [Hypoxylon sp. FL1284]|nr:hypothetical protein GGR52DRAFT_562766 [Hypoxylon sp. FL1284]